MDIALTHGHNWGNLELALLGVPKPVGIYNGTRKPQQTNFQ